MRNIVCIALIALCFNVQAQKKELRKIDKLVLESFWEEAKDELETSKSLILSSEDKYKAQFYFYDAKVSNELKDFKNAINSLGEAYLLFDRATQDVDDYKQTILKRFSAPEVKDELIRVARNPLIKFNKSERFHAPLDLLLKNSSNIPLFLHV